MTKNDTLPVRALSNDNQHPKTQHLNGKKNPPKKSEAKQKTTTNQTNSTNSTNKKPDVTIETKGDEVHLSISNRRYRIRGLEKNNSSQQLKVNILAARDDGGLGDSPLVHLDTFDLYKARSRTSFIKATATELFTDDAVIKSDIGTMLLELEQLQQGAISLRH